MPDEAPEPEVVLDEVEAETPPVYPAWHSQHGTNTPSISAPASPSLSLHSLIMSPLSPFSPLRHQYPASPELRRPSTSTTDHEEPGHDDVREEDRDILIQRLNDLASRLSGGELHGKSVESMHAQVDGLEKLVDDALKGRTLRPRDSRSSLGSRPEHRGSFSRPLSPIWPRVHFADLPPPASQILVASLRDATEEAVVMEEQDEEQDKSAPKEDPKEDPKGEAKREPGEVSPHVQQLLIEAQCLQEALESVVSNLQARQEEQEHIHDLLITRAERAAQRILSLEERISELENERNEGEMEVLNLQIQLKAIEVQCLNYVPRDADPELLDSIETWKAEWSALKRKQSQKKREALAASGPPTPRGLTPRNMVTRSRTTG